MIENGVFEYIIHRIGNCRQTFENNDIKRKNIVQDFSMAKGSTSVKDWMTYRFGNQANHVYTVDFKNGLH